MVFSSFTFLFIFLPIVLLCYFIIKSRKIRNVVLLAFSLIFYAWGEPKYIVLMLFSIILNYFIAILMDNEVGKKRKILLTIDIIINVLMLVIFKYTNFIINTFNSLFNFTITNFNIVLPIGISFYTFQILSYVIDVYNKKVKVQNNIINLGTYVSLFPQLIAGPIVRYETIDDELDNRKENISDIASGLRRFIIGLGKKVIIANNMAVVADTLYNGDISSYGTVIMWIAAIAYTLQIYFDFSGYSDMAIGLGKVFGFNFLENFNYPYIAKSVTEFWRRWHISLSSWFKDYIYIPLGGNRVNKLKWIRNILIVWLLTGLWHGASWNFVLWGAYYGILLLLEKLFLQKLLNKLPKLIQPVYTIFIVIVGWVLFRVEDFSQILIVLKKMFVFENSHMFEHFVFNFDVFTSSMYFIIAIIACFPIVKLFQKYRDNTKIYILKNVYVFIILVICICLLLSSTYNPFIYFRF